MMIGVAQVIGMKPTLRSFFSGVPASANASVAVLIGKNCDSAASAVEAPTDFRNARRVLWKYRAHHRGGDHTLIALVFAYPFHRLAAQRQRRPLMLGRGAMLAA